MSARDQGRVMCLVALAAFLSFSGKNVVLANPGEITSVQVAQDLSSVSIQSQGGLGKHAAFVIDRPYRLVIDFDEGTIGNIKPKIRVERPPINEIRLGYHNNRARVVIDFGENPVPPYQIQRNGEALVVSLGRSAALPPGQVPSRPETSSKKQSAKPPERATPIKQSPPKPSATPPPATVESAPHPPAVSGSEMDDSAVAVKDAGVKSSLVYVELVNKTDPRISYRLIVDLDLEALNMRSASLSDAKGNIRKFHVSRTETEKLSGLPSGNRFLSGPKRHWPTSFGGSSPAFSETNSGRVRDRGLDTAAKTGESGWPLKIEEFHPRPRDAVR